MQHLLAAAALLQARPSLPSLQYSHLELHTPPGQLDRWTLTSTGCCGAGAGVGAGDCPCCAEGGCPCPGSSRCVQCGLHQSCHNSKLYLALHTSTGHCNYNGLN